MEGEPSGSESAQRDLARDAAIGPGDLWKRWSGYHRRSLVEAKMRCVKLTGEPVMARDFDRQVAELQVRAQLISSIKPLSIIDIMTFMEGTQPVLILRRTRSLQSGCCTYGSNLFSILTLNMLIIATNGLLAMLLVLLGLCCPANAASGRDLWAYPIPVPSSAAGSPPLHQALHSWNRKQLSEARECGHGLHDLRPDLKFRKTFDLPYSNEYRVIFDSSKLYSVAVTINRYCGGAYPSTDRQAVSWEVESGRAFDPLTLYRIGKRKENSIEVLPEVQQMIRENLLKKARIAAKGPECRKILQEDSLNFLEPDSIGLTKSGVYVVVSGVHSVQFCYDPIVLTHKQISKYLQREVAAKVGWIL